ncbi:hypothetical protein B0E45_26195 [Sinorhizobium sp. A49]|uniref:hypothetical protein n=1 Tax=Sinorhizobium sp. A49 TaxID=1945861 RepID=UPI00098503D8|nr:hypothetical protein [Sinorhizobium sp. A49]OOG66731.1 hypothetical protein B0E45_26195 [Sinorhizobium sp. A49]
MSDGPARLPHLGTDKRDVGVAVLRAVAGSVPLAGAVLSELVTNLVPDQRMDRLEKYLTELARRLDEVAQPDRLRELFDDPTNVALMEDGAYQAARAITGERIQRIVDCVAYGIAAGEVDNLLKRRVLTTLGELDDQHLAILRAHSIPSYRAVDRLRPRPVATLGRPPSLKELEGTMLWYSALGKLERMALLDFKPKLKAIENLYPVPQYDREGRLEGTYQITSFGSQLLVSAGLAREG